MSPIYTVTEALERMKKFCAYQERCASEVRLKLQKEGFRGEEAEFVLAELISEGFLNEERFARAFVRGKFRMKQWGRVKIENELKMRGVSSACIRAGMKEIREDAYRSTLEGQIRKLGGVPEDRKSRYAQLRKLMARGFEPALIQSVWGSAVDMD